MGDPPDDPDRWSACQTGLVTPTPDRPSSAFQQGMARWTGPIFLLIGLAWLAMIPFTSGIQTIRWILGVSFVICGLTGWISYLRQRRSK